MLIILFSHFFMEISGKNFSSVFGVRIEVCNYVNPYFGCHKKGGYGWQSHTRPHRWACPSITLNVNSLIYAVFVDFRPLYRSLPYLCVRLWVSVFRLAFMCALICVLSYACLCLRLFVGVGGGLRLVVAGCGGGWC